MKAVSKDVPRFFNWNKADLTKTTEDWTSNVAATAFPNQVCMDLTSAASIRTALSINDKMFNVTKMPGCGLAVLNTRYSNFNTGGTVFNNTIWGTGTGAGNPLAADITALICAACSPNYKPTFFQGTITWNNADINVNKNWFVTKCDPIPNCTSSSNVMMNGC